jgi:hypothetical protein
MRFIAVPGNHGESLFFMDLNDLLDYSQLKKEEIKTAVTEGFPVYMAGKRYFIDEALS